ncbi:MAG: beta/gamma crystallin-related protein [Pseudomonadota bacterium]
MRRVFIGLTALIVSASALAPAALADHRHRGGPGYVSDYPVILFTRDDFRGRAVGIDGPTNLRDVRFNNKPDSIIVEYGRWIVCTKRNLRGRCQVIGRSVRNLDRLDLGEKISSIAPYRRHSRRYSRRGWR